MVSALEKQTAGKGGKVNTNYERMREDDQDMSHLNDPRPISGTKRTTLDAKAMLEDDEPPFSSDNLERPSKRPKLDDHLPLRDPLKFDSGSEEEYDKDKMVEHLEAKFMPAEVPVVQEEEESESDSSDEDDEDFDSDGSGAAGQAWNKRK